MNPAHSRPQAEILTRSQAYDRGLERYFTGQPCKNGHISERRVRSYGCIECEELRDRYSRARGISARGRDIVFRGEGRISEREEYRRAFFELLDDD